MGLLYALSAVKICTKRIIVRREVGWEGGSCKKKKKYPHPSDETTDTYSYTVIPIPKGLRDEKRAQ